MAEEMISLKAEKMIFLKVSLKAEKMIFRRALEAYRQERLDKCLRRMARERAKASKLQVSYLS